MGALGSLKMPEWSQTGVRESECPAPWGPSPQQGSLEPLGGTWRPPANGTAGKLQRLSTQTQAGSPEICSNLRGSKPHELVGFILSESRASGHLLSVQQLHGGLPHPLKILSLGLHEVITGKGAPGCEAYASRA